MASFFPYILDRFLNPEPVSVAPATELNSKLPSRDEGSCSGPSTSTSGAYRNILMLPERYKIFETAPAPNSSSSFPPSSPYIVNHRRHRQNLQSKLPSHCSVGREPLQAIPLLPPLVSERSEKINGNGDVAKDLAIVDNSMIQENINGNSEKAQLHNQDARRRDIKDDLDVGNACAVMEQESVRPVDVESGSESADDDFYDPVDSLSIASNTDANDTDDETSKHDSSRSARKTEAELRERILTEVGRRKQAEEQLENLKRQWQMLSHHLSHLGLALPPLNAAADDKSCESHDGPGADLSQQITVSRVVAAAIARAITRADVLEEMGPLIDAKNAEIARLSDKLQIYETMNMEMSHRTVEIANQERCKRKQRQWWLQTSTSLAVTGAATITWMCLALSSTSCTQEMVDAGREQ